MIDSCRFFVSKKATKAAHGRVFSLTFKGARAMNVSLASLVWIGVLNFKDVFTGKLILFASKRKQLSDIKPYTNPDARKCDHFVNAKVF